MCPLPSNSSTSPCFGIRLSAMGIRPSCNQHAQSIRLIIIITSVYLVFRKRFFLTLTITFLMKESLSANRSVKAYRTNAIPIQYPPEELGLMLSGVPRRLSANTSVVPALGPSR